MKTAAGCVLLVLLMSQSAASTPVQWPVSQGGNGHYYEILDGNTTQHTWVDASRYGEFTTYAGLSGHLVTITSQQELQWILQAFPLASYPPVAQPFGHDGVYFWIGAIGAPICRMPGYPDDPYGYNWDWQTGESWGTAMSQDIGGGPACPTSTGPTYGECFWGFNAGGSNYFSGENRELGIELAHAIIEYDGRPITIHPWYDRAVYWKISQGGNGHCYEFSQRWPEHWSLARGSAEGMTCLGVAGHLVTFDSIEEEQWVSSALHRYDCWIGLRQVPGSPEPDGGWEWVTGEPMTNTHWLPGEPNNSAPGQNFAVLNINGAESGWSDVADGGRYFIVEYDLTPQLPFVDVTDAFSGLDDFGSGNSVAWIDYDNDGDLDLSVGAGANNINRLFLNRLSENGTVSFDSVNNPLIANPNTTRGLGWGIFNPGDLCPDLYQGAPYTANVMLDNSCGSVADVTNTVTAGTSDETNGIRVVDFDGDGKLDIHELRPHAPDRLLKNLGNWQFQEMPASAISIGEGSFDAAWGDVDGDGDQDVYVTRQASQPNVLLRNDGGGVFADVTTAPLAITDSSAGASWGDYDNDGDLDLCVTNWLAANNLFRNEGSFNFTDVTIPGMAVSRRGQSAVWGDLNNDGWLDLYVANQGDPNQLWTNVPDGAGGRTLEDVTFSAVANLGPSTGVGFADYDQDGDLDIYVGAHLGRNTLLRNELAPGSHWLQVKLAGTQSNASGIGSRVTVAAGGLTMQREVGANNGMWSQESLQQHFGLGADAGPVQLTVYWPSGAVTDTTIAVVDQSVMITEPHELLPVYTPGCLAFDGADDHVATSGVSLPSGSSDRTLEFWVKSDNFAQGGDRAIAGWGATNTNQYCAIALGHDNAPTRKLFLWGWFNDLDWSTPLSDNTWYHVAFTLQSNVACLYLNGFLEYTGAMPPLDTASNSSFQLCQNANISQRFGGSLDEVRVWDRALTAEEINARMYSCLDASAESGLVLYWPLNEGFGAVTHDLSGHGSHGYIAGATWNEDSHPVRLSFAIDDKSPDQGGYLDATWRGGDAGGQSCWGTITSYAIQRFSAGEWMQVAQVEATAVETYHLTVETQDVFTAGQPAPYSRYRLVAGTTDPGVFIYSNVDSAYSVDNLPPPKPAAMLVDDLSHRFIFWTDPGLPDFATACVYRGAESGFTPGVALGCPNDFYNEYDLGWYFYRVQFSDTHGNLSEFSDELHGRWPTPVPEAVPHALKLYPCQPNPFNPRTTIKYDLPAAGPVRLSVFDVAGRLVRTLVDESAAQGSHDVVWDGRDASGREVGSGSYLARLEFGGKVETARMGLVR